MVEKPFESHISIINAGLPNVLQRSSASLVHHRNRRTMFICCVIVLMSAVSAIGLQLCPMATNEKCSNDSDIVTNNGLDFNPVGVFKSSLIEKKADPDFQVNVYVSAIIHHTNITINSDKAINIDMKTVDNITATTTGQHSVWQKIFPEFLRSLINDSVDAEQQANSEIEAELPDNDFLKANINFTNNLLSDPVDPCSHPEYIVFTWVSTTTKYWGKPRPKICPTNSNSI